MFALCIEVLELFNSKTKIDEGTIIQHRVTIGETDDGIPIID